ncbi:MAG: Type 1 glutamine amidotransferase-like domain-containing protein [Gemmatimonadaceae bacterium]
MKRRDFLVSSTLGSVGLGVSRRPLAGKFTELSLTPDHGMRSERAATRKILIAGGGFGTAFIRYMATLTGKKRPKLLYLPTASADRPDGSITWFRNCAPLDVEPSVQESFIASSRQSRSWEEVFLSVDGIVASGGNTLNQQAIWKAQGIDVILGKAWDRGIVPGGFLKRESLAALRPRGGSRPLYQKLIGSGQLKPGYAYDNDAGIYFEDNAVKCVVHTRADAKVYHVRVVNGESRRTRARARDDRLTSDKAHGTRRVQGSTRSCEKLLQRESRLHGHLRLVEIAQHDGEGVVRPSDVEIAKQVAHILEVMELLAESESHALHRQQIRRLSDVHLQMRMLDITIKGPSRTQPRLHGIVQPRLGNGDIACRGARVQR